jgi:hypothetical protein
VSDTERERQRETEKEREGRPVRREVIIPLAPEFFF